MKVFYQCLLRVTKDFCWCSLSLMATPLFSGACDINLLSMQLDPDFQLGKSIENVNQHMYAVPCTYGTYTVQLIFFSILCDSIMVLHHCRDCRCLYFKMEVLCCYSQCVMQRLFHWKPNSRYSCLNTNQNVVSSIWGEIA